MGEAIGEPGKHELEDPLGTLETGQVLETQIDSCDAVFEVVGNQGGGRAREEDLPTVAESSDAGAAIDRRAHVVVLVAKLGCTGM